MYLKLLLLLLLLLFIVFLFCFSVNWTVGFTFFPHRELWDLDDNQQLVGIWHKSTIWSAEIKLNFIRKIFLDTELQNQILEFFNIIIIIIFNVGVCIFNMACWKLESVVATIALCHLRGYFTIHFPKNKYIKTLGAFLYSFFF